MVKVGDTVVFRYPDGILGNLTHVIRSIDLMTLKATMEDDPGRWVSLGLLEPPKWIQPDNGLS